jgi:hypothetical protein
VIIPPPLLVPLLADPTAVAAAVGFAAIEFHRVVAQIVVVIFSAILPAMLSSPFCSPSNTIPFGAEIGDAFFSATVLCSAHPSAGRLLLLLPLLWSDRPLWSM